LKFKSSSGRDQQRNKGKKKGKINKTQGMIIKTINHTRENNALPFENDFDQQIISCLIFTHRKPNAHETFRDHRLNG